MIFIALLCCFQGPIPVYVVAEIATSQIRASSLTLQDVALSMKDTHVLSELQHEETLAH